MQLHDAAIVLRARDKRYLTHFFFNDIFTAGCSSCELCEFMLYRLRTYTNFIRMPLVIQTTSVIRRFNISSKYLYTHSGTLDIT